MSRKFLFLLAGRGAQPEVAKAIRRFHTLPEAVRSRVPSLWGWLLGPDGTPPYKFDREEIGWAQSPVGGRKCANCQRWYIHYVTNIGICDSVSGRWEGDWWCSRWTPPLNKEDYEDYQR
jgi:hypothetical protein